MKNMKRIASLLLALAMVFSLATTAFAAEGDPSITINDAYSGHTYTAYQIFKGTLNDGVLTDVQWGDNVNGDDLLDDLKGYTGTDFATTDKDGEQIDNVFANCTDAKSVAEALSAFANDSAALDEFALLAAANKSGNGKTGTLNGTTYTISDLEVGYYLVLDTDNDSTNTDDAISKNIVQVVGAAKVYNKADYPDVKKEIVDAEDKTVNEASIGDTVSYKITGELPDNLGDFDTYYYKFTDTLSAGLTYKDDLKITLKNAGEDDQNVTGYFYVKSTGGNGAATVITVAIEDLLALNNVTGLTVDNDTKIVLEYTATLNENAEIGTTGNSNKVKLEYSNNPNQDGEGSTDTPTTYPTDSSSVPSEPTSTNPTGKTPDKEVITYTTQLTITKKDGSTMELMPGVEFTLSGNGVNVVVVTEEKYVTDNENGTYYLLDDGTYTDVEPNGYTGDKYKLVTEITKTAEENNGVKEVVGVIGDDGTLTFKGLGAGDYTLTETTPDGYNSIDPIKFTIGFVVENDGTVKFTSSNGDIDVDETNYTMSAEILNYKGSTLPETGGMGTTLFYIFGGILVAAAVVLLVTKKRMSTAE